MLDAKGVTLEPHNSCVCPTPMAAVGTSSSETLFPAPAVANRFHALCTQGAKCFRCVYRVCNSPPGDAMRPRKSSKHRVHVACTVQVPYRVEVTCKVCAPKPRLSPRPRKNQVRRRFNPQWKVGRPWLHFGNGVMSCLACRAYPHRIFRLTSGHSLIICVSLMGPCPGFPPSLDPQNSSRWPLLRFDTTTAHKTENLKTPSRQPRRTSLKV